MNGVNVNPSKFDTQDNGRHLLDPEDEAPHDRISTTYAPRTGRLLAFAAAGLALLLLVGFALAYEVRRRYEDAAEQQAATASDAKAAVDVVFVQPIPKSYPLTLPGQAAGWYESTIYARVDGYVESWSADIGDRVKQGQVLAVIDTPELDQQLNAATAKAASSEAEVLVAQSNVSIAKLTYERWRDSPKGVVSEQEREEKKASYDSATAHLTQAKAQAHSDEADVGRYSAMEAFKKVTAPYNGIVTARHIDIGNLVSAGSSANTTPLYNIAQSNVIRVFVDVPQKAGADAVVGMPAYVTSNQFSGRIFHGKVARTAMSIDPQTRTERTEVDIPNNDLTLVPGMYLQLTFELSQRGFLQVPAAAILFQPSGLQVAVVDAASKVNFRPVTVAKDDGDTVELASGVNPGERVALNISSAITPGEQVEAIEDDKDQPSAPPATASPAPSMESGGPASINEPAIQNTPVSHTAENSPAIKTVPVVAGADAP
jgi:RND family efflux transporter MFP subunit